MADSQQYQVLARKWRPRSFDQVVGQRPVVQTLANALQQGRVAHAYCFSGIRGVGKTTLARLLAKGLNCRSFDQPTATPCGTCESCVEIDNSRSMDVIELDAASHTGVDNVRDLTEVTRYAPSRDRYRVFIMDEAHMLSRSAFNALLKTLEEPPEHVVFVLATTEPEKIPTTVLSRCQQYPFERISQAEIRAHLQRLAQAEEVTISEDALALVAMAADGSLRDGQSLLDKLIAFAGDTIDEQVVSDLLGLVDKMLLHRAVDRIGAGDVPGVLMLVNEMVDSGVDLHRFTIDLLGYFRDLLVVRSIDSPGEILHLADAEIDSLRQQASCFEIDDLDRAFSLLASNEYRIKQAEQPRYHVEVMLARLARMPRLEPLESLIAALQSETPATTPEKRPRPSGRSAAPPRRETASASRSQSKSAPETARPAPPPESDRPAPPPEQDSPALPDEPTATSTAPASATPAVETHPSTLLSRIQEHVDHDNPMIGPVLRRTSSISLAGETILFRFPASAKIFADRIRDPQVLTLLGAAAEKVLGRRAIARVEIDPSAVRPAAPAEAGIPVPAEPTASRSAAAPGAVAASEQIAPPRADPARDDAESRSALRQRVEQEPLVQEFVKALRGQITSVEEL